jgi:hypothetical protein
MPGERRKRQIARGAPGFAETQREKILKLLRESGPAGVSRQELIFQHRYTQCGARIDELKRQGYRIESELRPSEKFVTYVLREEPPEPRPLPTFKRATGLPLFDAAARR